MDLQGKGIGNELPKSTNEKRKYGAHKGIPRRQSNELESSQDSWERETKRESNTGLREISSLQFPKTTKVIDEKGQLQQKGDMEEEVEGMHSPMQKVLFGKKKVLERQREDQIELEQFMNSVAFTSEASLIRWVKFNNENHIMEGWNIAKDVCSSSRIENRDAKNQQNPRAYKLDEKTKKINGSMIDKNKWANYRLKPYRNENREFGIFMERPGGCTCVAQHLWYSFTEKLEENQLDFEERNAGFEDCEDFEGSEMSSDSISISISESMPSMSSQVSFSQDTSYSPDTSQDSRSWEDDRLSDIDFTKGDKEMLSTNLRDLHDPKSRISPEDKLRMMLLLGVTCEVKDEESFAKLRDARQEIATRKENNMKQLIDEVLKTGLSVQELIEDGFDLCDAFNYDFVSMYAVMKFANEVVNYNAKLAKLHGEDSDDSGVQSITVESQYQERLITQLRRCTGVLNGDASDEITESQDLAELIVDNLPSLYPSVFVERTEMLERIVSESNVLGQNLKRKIRGKLPKKHVGETVGEKVGLTVGEAVGDTVGDTVGDKVGVTVGEAVELRVGEVVGLKLGENVGLLTCS